MAVQVDPAIEEEEESEEESEEEEEVVVVEEEHGGPTHHPSPPPDESFDLSTTVDPSYIISLIRRLLQYSLTDNKKDGAAPHASNDIGEHLESSTNKYENMDVDCSGNDGSGNGLDEFAPSPEDLAVWEEYGCVLWDLAASKTHAQLMVENHILRVLWASLAFCESPRIAEICTGIIGNIACHEVLMKYIVHCPGLIGTIVNNFFLDNPQCLCETCRLFTVGLQSDESISWAKELQSEKMLHQILWIAENTLDLQLLEKSMGLILAILESQQKVADALLPPMMKLGLASKLICLLASEISKLMTERIPQRYSVLDLILRAIEALSVVDDHSQEICSSKELFQLVCDLVKFPDKAEVGNCCVTAAVIIANILSEATDRASEISQDLSLFAGLLDIFPFASDDLEARNALWNVIARIMARIPKTEISPSSVYNYVSVLVSKIDLIEDELLNPQLVHCSHDQESLASPSSTADARNISLRRIISILNQWYAARENDENMGNAEVLVNETDVKKLMDCCLKYSK